MKFFYLLFAICFSVSLSTAQDAIIPLWPEGIPCENDLVTQIEETNDSRRIKSVNEPLIAAYLPSAGKANGTGVVICPGGGYYLLAWDKEGAKIAEWFNSIGVAAFVLQYRLPHWEAEDCRSQVALMDAQRAIRIVRSRAKEWRLSPNRIGVMGFSAGGHLASTISTHFDMGEPSAKVRANRVSSRPDFSILMYPVISMDSSITHSGSKRNLLGEEPTEDDLIFFSNEKQVTAATPPTLLIHADNDGGVVAENSIAYYLALRKEGIPAALHIYELGGHGFGLAENMGSVSGWPQACKGWLEDRGLMSKHLRALIVDGQHNQDNWPETTVIMKDILEENGRFTVDIATTPSQGLPMDDFKVDFSPYDVIISNYNGQPWPEEVQRDFEYFVKRGGGFVSVHAADNAFPDWEAYNAIIGIGGWGDRNEEDGPYVYLDDSGTLIKDDSPGSGGHRSSPHEFVVDVARPYHPIMRDMPTKWLHTKDELYDQLRGPAHNLTVLASAYSAPNQKGSGRHEPVAMTIHYGFGRVFHTTLGRFNESRLCIGFATLLQRGAEWAATGKVTQAIPTNFPTAKETSMRKVEEEE